MLPLPVCRVTHGREKVPDGGHRATRQLAGRLRARGKVSAAPLAADARLAAVHQANR